ncbi:hypothetical protein CRENBAI_004936, partial [Crenichthys baileyi]
MFFASIVDAAALQGGREAEGTVVLLTVLVCSEAQNMINVTGELGQDVPLTCSFSSPDIIWVMEVHNRIRAGTGRTYSSDPTYYSPDLETKYSISENRLLVRNLSAEDSRFYFCRRKDDGRTVYGDTIRLIISVVPVPVSTSPSDHQNVLTTPSSDCEAERLTFILYRSAVVLSFLLSLTAGQCGVADVCGWRSSGGLQ